MNRDSAGAIQARSEQLNNFFCFPPTADVLIQEFTITGALLRDAGLLEFLRSQHSERWAEMNEFRRRGQVELEEMRKTRDPEAVAQAEKAEECQRHWRESRVFVWRLLRAAAEGDALAAPVTEMLGKYDLPNELRDELNNALGDCVNELTRLLASEPEAGTPTTEIGRGLVLPDPMPDGTNPFLVIDWILFTGYVAARHLTDARVKRVEELGRKMRTDERNGVEYLHWEDEVDCRCDISRLFTDRTFLRWSKALCDARNLCAEFGIPFTEYDPVLKTAEELMNDRECIIAGVASDREAYASTSIGKRLHELAHSTTPRRLQTDLPPLAAVMPVPSAPPAGTQLGETPGRVDIPLSDATIAAAKAMSAAKRAIIAGQLDTAGLILDSQLESLGSVNTTVRKYSFDHLPITTAHALTLSGGAQISPTPVPPSNPPGDSAFAQRANEAERPQFELTEYGKSLLNPPQERKKKLSADELVKALDTAIEVAEYFAKRDAEKGSDDVEPQADVLTDVQQKKAIKGNDLETLPTTQPGEEAPKPPTGPGWEELGEAKQAVLIALKEAAERMQGPLVAEKAGYTYGSLRHHFPELQTWGYIDKTRNGYAITSAGAALVPPGTA